MAFSTVKALGRCWAHSCLPLLLQPLLTPQVYLSLGVERESWAFSTGNQLETSHLLCLNGTRGEQRGAGGQQHNPGQERAGRLRIRLVLSCRPQSSWLTKDSR